MKRALKPYWMMLCLQVLAFAVALGGPAKAGFDGGEHCTATSQQSVEMAIVEEHAHAVASEAIAAHDHEAQAEMSSECLSHFCSAVTAGAFRVETGNDFSATKVIAENADAVLLRVIYGLRRPPKA